MMLILKFSLSTTGSESNSSSDSVGSAWFSQILTGQLPQLIRCLSSHCATDHTHCNLHLPTLARFCQHLNEKEQHLPWWKVAQTWQHSRQFSYDNSKIISRRPPCCEYSVNSEDVSEDTARFRRSTWQLNGSLRPPAMSTKTARIRDSTILIHRSSAHIPLHSRWLQSRQDWDLQSICSNSRVRDPLLLC